MDKIFEALKFIFGEALFSEYKNETSNKVRECNAVVYSALTELKQIKEAKSSEAVECLEWIIKNYIGNDYYKYEEELITIKQALLKLNFLEDAMDLPTNCFSTFKNRNGDEVAVMRTERYEEYQEFKKVSAIFKNKPFNMIYFVDEIRPHIYKHSYSDYNTWFFSKGGRPNDLLTEEEFNILKRWSEKRIKNI